MLRRFVVASLTAAIAVSCRRQSNAIDVAVVFNNSWKLGSEILNESEIALLKRTATDALSAAYDGYDIHFIEGTARARTVKVEDTPAISDPRARPVTGAAGVTYPMSTVSSVRFDVLVSAEMEAARCQDLSHCGKSRDELLRGLGAGIGATAAHELGHQLGFRFALDVPCDDCYDGFRSNTKEHFFGKKHWSPRSSAIMTKVLPPLDR